MISFYLKKPTSCFLFLQFWIVQFFDSLWTHCKCLNPIAIFYKIRIDYDSFLCSASDSLLYRKSQYGAPSAMVPVLTNFICIISARQPVPDTPHPDTACKHRIHDSHTLGRMFPSLAEYQRPNRFHISACDCLQTIAVFPAFF